MLNAEPTNELGKQRYWSWDTPPDGRYGRSSEHPMGEWRDQEATNETIFGEMNEWSEEANDARLGMDRPMDACLCECSDCRCSESISLTRSEYGDVRTEGARFAIALTARTPRSISWFRRTNGSRPS